MNEAEMELEFVLPGKVEKTAEKFPTDKPQTEVVAEKPAGDAKSVDKSEKDDQSETAKSDSRANEDAVKPQEPAQEAEVEILVALETEGAKK